MKLLTANIMSSGTNGNIILGQGNVARNSVDVVIARGANNLVSGDYPRQ